VADRRVTVLKLLYSTRYAIDIGPHIFPTEKYQRIYDRWRARTHSNLDCVVEPEPVTWDQLGLVHTSAYLDKVQTLTLSSAELRELELPLDRSIVEGFRLMTGGTVTAARLAAQDGLAAHIGGGFHHAFAGHGEGFCLFNDVAVALEVLRRDEVLSRAAVVDLDVHHGNGTAMIYGRDPSVFTFSMHERHNYPVYKPPGSLDIGLAAGTDDATYLERLEAALPRVVAHEPDLVVYLAGADPFEDDQLGNLELSKAGLRERDEFVLHTMREAGCPIVILPAGGYARELADTVDIHVATIEAALALPISVS